MGRVGLGESGGLTGLRRRRGWLRHAWPRAACLNACPPVFRGVLAQRSSRRESGGVLRVVCRGVLVASDGRERTDPCQRAGVVAVPWPSGREVQCPAASVAGKSTGNAKQSAAECAGGTNRGVR